MLHCSPSGRIRPGTDRAFTLLEIILAVAIMMVLLLLAVPSLTGVLSDKKLRRSLDGFNALVREAQERSVTEHRPYLIVWHDKGISLRPEALAKGEEVKTTAGFVLRHGDVLKLSLPAALTKNPPAEWIFWPAGVCEPAIVEFSGDGGMWTANYS
ncbi:MAG: hypothetical protein ABI925_01970, partial [Verrucomicrobiota bacterium]